MPYVYSTATNDAAYVEWQKGGADLPVRARTITVKGGRGWTPTRGKSLFPGITEITPEEADFLMRNEDFIRHEKAGFVRIEAARADAEKVIADMEINDGSAPLTEEDFKAEVTADDIVHGGAPKVGKGRKK